MKTMKKENQSWENLKEFLSGSWTKIKTSTVGIYNDIKKSINREEDEPNLFIKNRWHLHGLALPGIILFNLIAFYYEWQIGFSKGIGGNLLVQMILSFLVSLLIEIRQPAKTANDRFESNKDLYFTMYSAWLGIFIFLLIYTFLLK